MIVEEEKSLACLDLVVKYYRGLVYFRARELIHDADNIKTAFRTEFGVCYNTAMRYITFAALIKRYPRLMICGLTYPQIIKHQKRLLNHLKTNTALHDMLSQPLEMLAQDKVVEISPSDIDVPKVANSTDPDYVFEDYFNDPADDDIPEDEEEADWLDKTSKEIFEKTEFDSSVEEMTEVLKKTSVSEN
jgi:hypothetical protein